MLAYDHENVNRVRN